MKSRIAVYRNGILKGYSGEIPREAQILIEMEFNRNIDADGMKKILGSMGTFGLRTIRAISKGNKMVALMEVNREFDVYQLTAALPSIVAAIGLTLIGSALFVMLERAGLKILTIGAIGAIILLFWWELMAGKKEKTLVKAAGKAAKIAGKAGAKAIVKGGISLASRAMEVKKKVEKGRRE